MRCAAGILCLALALENPPQSFDEFLAGIRAEALEHGIRQATIDAALAGLTAPEPAVVEKDRAQPEVTQSLDQYLSQRLTTQTIQTARKMLHVHGPLLRKIERTYGVPPPVMVAIWGLESNFGRVTGTYATIPTLVTLAYDDRRPRFRAELFDALAIVDQGVLSPAELKGSWAGAMGQPQFIPSSYRKHAVDFDGDGRADIWSSPADVFGSIANYLKNAGWQKGERWGREVKITRTVLERIDRTVAMRTAGCGALRNLTVERPLSEWSALGVTLRSGARLPESTLEASLVRGEKRHFLVYRNYKAILDYNCSNSYAVSVGELAVRIGG
jgi:peptidoglycan lytic transglycosylase B